MFLQHTTWLLNICSAPLSSVHDSLALDRLLLDGLFALRDQLLQQLQPGLPLLGGLLAKELVGHAFEGERPYNLRTWAQDTTLVWKLAHLGLTCQNQLSLPWGSRVTGSLPPWLSPRAAASWRPGLGRPSQAQTGSARVSCTLPCQSKAHYVTQCHAALVPTMHNFDTNTISRENRFEKHQKCHFNIYQIHVANR